MVLVPVSCDLSCSRSDGYSALCSSFLVLFIYSFFFLFSILFSFKFLDLHVIVVLVLGVHSCSKAVHHFNFGVFFGSGSHCC